MKIGNSVFDIVNVDNKVFVRHSYNGENLQSEDMMMVYGLNTKPYVKRLGTKMYLPEELAKELREGA
ncbi:MAG: hypothetical protein J6S23_02410 [Clostridia bacterium]|nr:hypothetical protein [Clostridia bacterium]